MEKEINMENKIERIEIKEAESILFDRWLTQEVLHDTVAPTIDEQDLRRILFEAKENNQEVMGLAVGCQQFAEVSGDNGVSVATVRNLDDRDGGRADRFAEGISSLQQSFGSWGVQLKFFLTMSDMEGNAFVHNNNSKGMFEFERIDRVMRESLDSMSHLISKHGGSVKMFSHSDVLKEVMNVDSFEDIIDKLELSEEENQINVQTMLWRLYETDPIFLVEWINQNSSSDIVWFDLMSSLAGKHREKLQSEIIKNHSNMPILALLNNAGKWETPPQAHRVFRSKQEFVSKILGVNTNPRDQAAWVRELMSKEDSLLEEFLSTLGIDLQVNSMKSKNIAIGMLESIVFGKESIKQDGLEAQEVVLPSEINIKVVLSDILNKPRGHIFNLIKNGSVKINGDRVSGLNIILEEDDLIEIGKKSKFRVKLNEG